MRKIGFSLMSDAKHFQPTLRSGLTVQIEFALTLQVIGKQEMDNDLRYFRFARRAPGMCPKRRRMLTHYEGVVNTIVQLRRTYACDVIQPAIDREGSVDRDTLGRKVNHFALV